MSPPHAGLKAEPPCGGGPGGEDSPLRSLPEDLFCPEAPFLQPLREELGQAPQASGVHTNLRVSEALLEETQTIPAPWAQLDCFKPLSESQKVKQMQKTVLFQSLPSLPPIKSVFAELGVWLPVC